MGSGCAQGHADLRCQGRSKFGAHVAPHFNGSTLRRQHDERAVSGLGFYTNPAPVKLCTLQPACCLPFHHKARALQRNPLAIRRMATVHGECNSYSQDFKPRERHHQACTEHPEARCDPQGHQAQGQIHPPQLRRRDRAITDKTPVNALTRHRGKTKNQARHRSCSQDCWRTVCSALGATGAARKFAREDARNLNNPEL